MSETWSEIASDLRVEGRPITSTLLKRYWERDEALREQSCAVPQLNATASDASWTTVLDSFIWVPTWAVTLNVTIATFMDTGAIDVRLLLNATASSTLTATWTSTQDDTLTITVAGGDLGSQQELLIQDENAGAEIIDITLRKLWWTQ